MELLDNICCITGNTHLTECVDQYPQVVDHSVLKNSVIAGKIYSCSYLQQVINTLYGIPLPEISPISNYHKQTPGGSFELGRNSGYPYHQQAFKSHRRLLFHVTDCQEMCVIFCGSAPHMLYKKFLETLINTSSSSYKDINIQSIDHHRPGCLGALALQDSLVDCC